MSDNIDRRLEIEEERKRELNIKINTEAGLINWESPIVTGKLNSVIIDSKEKVSITIESKFGYPIFHNAEHSGIKYYAPRAVLQGWEARIIVQDQFNKFKLNEPLNIRVNGPKNAEITIILRLD